MIAVARCAVCDRQLSTEADDARHDAEYPSGWCPTDEWGEAKAPHWCDDLCWRMTGECEGTPVDWRARCVEADARAVAAEAALAAISVAGRSVTTTSYTRLWYCYDPENKTVLYHTADEAEKAAVTEMQYYSDCAYQDFWHEDIDTLSWGEMVRYGETIRVRHTEPTEDHPDGTEEWNLVRLPVQRSSEPLDDALLLCRRAVEARDEELAPVEEAYRVHAAVATAAGEKILSPPTSFALRAHSAAVTALKALEEAK